MVLTEEQVTLVGSVAALLTTLAFVPQVVRVWRLRHARDISLPTFVFFAAGLFLWFLYGLFLGSPPIIIANAVTFVLALTILALKWRFDRPPARPGAP